MRPGVNAVVCQHSVRIEFPADRVSGDGIDLIHLSWSSLVRVLLFQII